MKALIALNKIESQRRTGSTVEADRPGARLTDAQRKLVSEYYFKGISYYSSNNYEKAIEEWRKVLAIDPGNEKAKSNIRKCLELIKR
jgi:tetratricopeptide (TPR) repeat protein